MTAVSTEVQGPAISDPMPTVFDEKVDLELPIPPFDPAIHLNYHPPTARHTFTELGLPVPKGCPDMCYTEPFRLFSEEGVRMIRREVFRRSFLDKYMKTWGENDYCIIRGHGHVKGVRNARILWSVDMVNSC